jgi:UDP-N-acetyl-2-amino-2-deoxyglucuronate dehydrogenase
MQQREFGAMPKSPSYIFKGQVFSMGEKLRFGIVGCGVIGKLHGQQLKLIQDAEIVAFADAIEERARAYAEEFGGQAYADYEEMLKNEQIDIISVCTPSGMHGDMAIAAAKYGKHVIVEKPINVTLEQADRMIAACREAGVTLSCIFQHRFDPATQRVKQHLERGKFGRLVLVNAHVHWYRSDAYYASGAWRGTWKLDGGGVLMNQAIHTVDLLQYLGGPVSQIYARTRNRLHPSIEVEDVAVATVDFAGGAIGTITATTCAYPGLSTRLEIIGEHGSCIIEDNKLIYEHFKTAEDVGTHGLGKAASNAVNDNDAGSEGVAHRVYGNTHYHQFEDVIRAIREHRDPLVTGEQARHALEIILAIYKSEETQQAVTLPLHV